MRKAATSLMLEGVVPWPEPAVELYRQLGYWRGEPIGKRFDCAVADNAARLAVVDGERRITYGELGAMVERLALHFAERGIASGRRVIFQLPNGLECVAAYFACLKTGAIPVATLPAHRHSEIGLPKLVFVGTGAWFFMLVNLFKVPFSVHLGLITPHSLWIDALLLIPLVPGALLGPVILKRINQRNFELMVLLLTAIATVRLVW